VQLRWQRILVVLVERVPEHRTEVDIVAEVQLLAAAIPFCERTELVLRQVEDVDAFPRSGRTCHTSLDRKRDMRASVGRGRHRDPWVREPKR
jgi:hypothetical protein